MILKGEIKDPRLRTVVLTGIKVTGDLGLAWIYFTVMTDDVGKEETLIGLRSASGFIKRELWKRLGIRRIPDLRFEFDNVLEEGYRIDELLKGAKSGRSGEGN